MTKGQVVHAYRAMTAADRSAFRKWLVVNTVVALFSVLALIAITSMYPGDSSDVLASQSRAQHAEAK